MTYLKPRLPVLDLPTYLKMDSQGEQSVQALVLHGAKDLKLVRLLPI
jgi:hypothetical protein